MPIRGVWLRASAPCPGAPAEGGGLGVSMSTLSQVEDYSAADEPHSIHSYALEGDIEKLATLLDSESVDIDAKDEYVSLSL